MARLRDRAAARERWREFESLAGEAVTASDAENVGLPAEWFQRLVRERFGAEDVRAEQLGVVASDPSIRDLLRYKLEQRRLRAGLGELLEGRLSAYDVIAADLGDSSLVAVARELFSGREDATVAEWIPHARRPVVARFLLGGDGRPSPLRVRSVVERAEEREALRRELAPYLDRAVDLEMAVQSGAGDGDLRRLVREWFGNAKSLTLDQLLLVRHVDAFARLLGWHEMMLGLSRAMPAAQAAQAARAAKDRVAPAKASR